MNQRRPPRQPPRLLSVIASQSISPNVLRLTLGGDSLVDFPETPESANVKLLLAHPGQSPKEYLESLKGNGIKPIKRTYTVLNYRPSQLEIDIDFALHANPGPATLWATQAITGDTIAVAGPGTRKLVNTAADWFLFCADLSSLPALEANLARLPQHSAGFCFIEIPDQADRRPLKAPLHLKIEWTCPGNQHRVASPLIEQVQNCQWLEGQVAAWVAGEASMVKAIKEYLISAHQLENSFRYTSGYWMHGRDEDGFQPYRMRQ